MNRLDFTSVVTRFKSWYGDWGFIFDICVVAPWMWISLEALFRDSFILGLISIATYPIFVILGLWRRENGTFNVYQGGMLMLPLSTLPAFIFYYIKDALSK